MPGGKNFSGRFILGDDYSLGGNDESVYRSDFPSGVTYHQIGELEAAIDGADFIICGVSSFGVEWFGDEVLPRLQEGIPVISVTKGLMDLDDGTLITYPHIWQERLDSLEKNIPLCAIGGPCTSYELVAHDQAKEELAGVTLESLVVAERVARAVRVKAEQGLANLEDFPLLTHIDEIITKKASVDIPWEKFTFVK